MAQNPNEVVVAVTGNILSFDTSTVVAFDDIYSKPATAIDHGLASNAGIVNSTNRSTTNIIAWQNAQNARTVVTEATKTFKVTLIQVNDENLELAFGVTKNPTTGAYHVNAGKVGKRRSFFLDIIDEAANVKLRYYIPSGEISDLGDISHTSGDAVGLDLTITAYLTDVAGEPANHLLWKGTAVAPVAP